MSVKSANRESEFDRYLVCFFFLHSEFSRDAGRQRRQGVDSDGVARLAEDAPVQRVTAAAFRLRGQQQFTVLSPTNALPSSTHPQ